MKIKGFLEFLVHSNLYLAFGAGINSIVVAFLLNLPIIPEIFFIPFSGSFLIYNLNRISDIREDEVNLPNRVSFIKKYGIKMFYLSIFFYLISITISFLRNFFVFLVILIPVIIGILYSFFRIKRITFIKNITVGFAWAFGNCMLVYTFFNIFNIQSLLIFLIFFLSFMINTIIFDIKDIVGDKIQKIITIPVKYGIRNTKKILYGIYFVLLLISLYFLTLNYKALILFPFLLFLGLCISYIKNERYPWWYFGVAVDGEFFILILSLLIYLWII